MGTIAYAAEETVLLTFDGVRLLGFDAIAGTPKWELTLPRAIVGVTFGAANAVGHDAAWRTGFSGSAGFAVDESGWLHVIDANAGRLLASIATAVEKPTAIVAALEVLAISGATCVAVWRDGARFEFAERATATVFTDNGKSLAVGTQRGDVVVFDVARRAPTYGHSLDTAVTAMAWSARSGFVVGTRRGLFKVEESSPKKLRGGFIRAVAVDPSGQNIAVCTDRATVTTARSTITFDGRNVRDLAFGPNELLGVSVTSGDIAVVDERRLLGIRAGRRDRQAWEVTVAALGERPEPRLSRLAPVVAALAAVGCVALAFTGMMRTRDDTSSVSSSPASILRDMKCDHGCEASRLSELRRTCAEQPAGDCENDADVALAAFEAAHCAESRASLNRIQNKVIKRGAKGSTLVKAYVSLAQAGLDKTCIEVIETTDPEPHVVRLGGPNLVPHLQPSMLGPVTAIHTTDEGDVLAVALDRHARSCRVWSTRADDSGKWHDIQTVTSCDTAKVFGRSGANLLFLFGREVDQLSGTTWTTIGYPGPVGSSIAQMSNGDVFVTSDEQLWRRHDGFWAREEIPHARGSLDNVVACGEELCLQVTPQQGERTQLWRRDRDGDWSIVMSDFAFQTLYATDHVVFLATDDEVMKWSDHPRPHWNALDKVPRRPRAFWVNAPREAYAGGVDGLMKYDGTNWSSARFDESISAMAGTKDALYVISTQRL